MCQSVSVYTVNKSVQNEHKDFISNTSTSWTLARRTADRLQVFINIGTLEERILLPGFGGNLVKTFTCKPVYRQT